MSSYHLIKDMEYKKVPLSLSYSSPCRGMWNIVHLATQVPQSHQVFVCPTSCLRGVVLTTAEMGCMDRLSTITVGEDNVLEGNLEETIQNGVEKILDSLPVRPRVVFIFTSCIHHFMATNYQRVYKLLRKEYPDIDFIDAYMDPIMRRKTPPLPSLQRQVYRMLQPTTVDPEQVNFIDNWFQPEWNDLYDHLVLNDIKVKDFASIKTYDEYLKMNASCLNVSFHKFGRMALKDMHLRLQQGQQIMHLTYDYAVIDQDMKEISEKLHIACLTNEDMQKLRDETETKIRKTKEKIGSTPISIDSVAIEEPLSLALFLSRNGFTVDSIFLDVMSEEKEIFTALQKEFPLIKIYEAENWNMRVLDRTQKNMLAIGQQAAYYNATGHFVNMILSAGMYGYKGIQHLMDLIADAYENARDIEPLISQKGWGCEAR